MAKKESTLLSMFLALFLVTLISATILGFVYEFTKDAIAASRAAKQTEALKKVLPPFNNNPVQEMYKKAVDGDTLYFFPAREDSALVGIAVNTFSPKGFSGMIRIMVGFLPDGTIKDVAVLEHKETPGLGEKMVRNKSNWSVQFQGKNPKTYRLAVKKDGGDVDAITASTISSRAFCDALERAYKYLTEGGAK
ncbi:MAG TPA: RnfABCDGE type electron transport complex subunit G [Bacteroidetes bacterium]|nr:RnfABCDGE type electron transport complex subunit G [Bacteroidota bacterium]